jgi:hypothetical protein
MRTALLLIGLAMFSSAFVSLAAGDAPPDNIIEHYKWCAVPADATERIRRYQGFWSRHHPADEEYEDAVHIRFVRLCAYDLAALYADTHDTKRAREMLEWLRLHDQAIPR